MAAMPMYGKTFFLRNQKSYDLITWHGASETQVLQIDIVNDDHRLTMTYFMVNLFSHVFKWGKLLE